MPLAIAGVDLQDWRLTYGDLEPYYEKVEQALQIAGPGHYPWQKQRRRFPQWEHQLNASANLLVRGCATFAIPVAAAPVATLSAPYRDWPTCVYRGSCNYGCSTNAKSSILLTYIPRAIRAGAEVCPNAMVARIEHDATGRVTGVLHFRPWPSIGHNVSELFRHCAKAIVAADYAIETPRLLLNSASSLFPDGLANSSGIVNRCFMIHAGHQMFAKFWNGSVSTRRRRDWRSHSTSMAPCRTLVFPVAIPSKSLDRTLSISPDGLAPHGTFWVPLRRALFDYNY
ncbi:MAG: GMC family oxidoreductase N-terminal domain-containing protein [Methylocella sp.]